MPVIFDSADSVTVDVPHGTYTVTRSQPASNWQLIVRPQGDASTFAGLEVTPTGTVKRLRFGVGKFSLELLDVLTLAALAFRDRDTARKAA